MTAIVRILFSLLGAGLFYTAWLAIAIPRGRLGGSELDIALLVAASLLTALGFGVGMKIGERITVRSGRSFWSAWLTAFVGCALGAVGIYRFGPMLIVFGIFGLGTLAISTRDLWYEQVRGRSGTARTPSEDE